MSRILNITSLRKRTFNSVKPQYSQAILPPARNVIRILELSRSLEITRRDLQLEVPRLLRPILAFCSGPEALGAWGGAKPNAQSRLFGKSRWDTTPPSHNSSSWCSYVDQDFDYCCFAPLHVDTFSLYYYGSFLVICSSAKTSKHTLLSVYCGDCNN